MAGNTYRLRRLAVLKSGVAENTRRMKATGGVEIKAVAENTCRMKAAGGVEIRAVAKNTCLIKLKVLLFLQFP